MKDCGVKGCFADIIVIIKDMGCLIYQIHKQEIKPILLKIGISNVRYLT